MTRQPGFPVGDFDTAFPLDDRVARLRTVLGDPIRALAAEGVWWRIVAAAWRDLARKPAELVCPEADPELVAALVTVGLLGTDQRMTKRTYMRWVAVAVARRRKATDAKRAFRAQKSGGSPGGVLQDTHRTQSVSQSVTKPARARANGAAVIDPTPYSDEAVNALILRRQGMDT